MKELNTKGSIKRLGDQIRSESGITGTTLYDLQMYRTSHKESISEVFNKLCELKKGVNRGAIITYRIKRFESIINKLHRYPKMQLNRMWDIAGCRIILRSEEEIYSFRKEIEKHLIVKKEYNYLEKPQDDGYRSLHLYVSLPEDDKTIEIQLRNTFFHNWATLVEISDLLFDAGLKEYGRNKTLLDFHFLLSKEILNISEKKKLSKIIQEYKYFEKLSEVFSRNYLHVRQQWTAIKNLPRQKFFLIESSKDEAPKIFSFERFSDAEEQYFNTFKTNSNANVVLTHLPKPDYQQISLAYSNYILTVHNFLEYSLSIIESLIVESLQNKAYSDFSTNYEVYNNIVYNHFKNVIVEISFAKEIFLSMKKIGVKKQKTDKKNSEWKKDIKHQLDRLVKNGNALEAKIQQNFPTSILGKGRVRRIMKRINKKYETKLKKVIQEVLPKKQ